MFSPTSIADFLACQHLTALNRAEDAKQIKRPYFPDPTLELLIRLGQAHEQAYLNQLTEQGLRIVEVPTEGSRRKAAAKTIEAIRDGADVIYQASFLADQDARDWSASVRLQRSGPVWYGCGEDACAPVG